MAITVQDLHNYERDNAAARYGIGFADRKVVWFVPMDTVEKLAKVERRAYRLKLTTTEKFLLYWHNAEAFQLCTLQELKEERDRLTKEAGKTRNMGHAFESMVCKYYGIEYQPHNLPFWEAPDVTINGVGYQLKYDGAEIIAEDTARRRWG